MGRPKKNPVAEAQMLSQAYGTAPAAAESVQIPEGAQDIENRPASRPSGPFRLPVALILALSLSALGEWILHLGANTQQDLSLARGASLAAWKLLELALGWFLNFDGYDAAALSVLSRGPMLYLLCAFYDIGALTAAASLGIEFFSSLVSFFLVRPASKAHAAPATVYYYGQEIVTDGILHVQTVLLAGLIYHITLFVAFRTFLPTLFVLYFEGIPTIRPALDTMAYGTVQMGILDVLFGLAVRAFIFTPYASQPPTASDQEVARFDPVSASAGETLWYNLWGYTTRTKVVIQRTAVVMALVGLTTYLRCLITIHGVESFGAAAYASVWVTGTLMTGIALGVIGNA